MHTTTNRAGSHNKHKWGEGGVQEHDTDLLVGVVTLARMVKLLLTVRRLANTWGMDGQRRRERRRREEEGAGGSGDKFTALIHQIFL